MNILDRDRQYLQVFQDRRRFLTLPKLLIHQVVLGALFLSYFEQHSWVTLHPMHRHFRDLFGPYRNPKLR